VEAVSAASATGSSVSLPVPAGTQPGEVLVAVVHQQRSVGTASAPGWTLVRNDGTGAKSAILWRVAGEVEPAAYTFSVGTDALIEAHMLRLSGADPAQPFGASGVRTSAFSELSRRVEAPSLTPSGPNMLLLAIFSGGRAGVSVTPPAGMTERTDTAAAATTSVADEARAGTSATGVRKATLSEASDRRIGQALLIRPRS
jgi:hypothetical protein